jgi:predicted TIM-barrel fold metal-dependent hydrolase
VVPPWPPALKLAYEFAGSDRLLFASDHPWVEIDVLSRLVGDMDIPAEDKDAIFGRNACALFDIGG